MVKRILLAEDDVDDSVLFEEVFSSLPPDEYALYTVDNGEEVIAFLNRINDPLLLPDLIILDQNMPLKNGKETLIYLKSVDFYRHIPVIIYSTYNDKNFIEECENLGVNAVVSKPDSYAGYIKMINTFLRYSSAPE